MRDWFSRLIQVTAATLMVAAILKEIEKPEEERQWHGKVACFVPYDFRLPTVESIMNAYWNPYDNRVMMPAVFGIGWAINFRALLEDMGIFKPDVTEEHFLMPTQSIKEVLAPEAEGE
jgi:hypothetical protein